MYKCAFLGCGPRARSHARAYQYVRGGQIAALCDMNEERLNAFGQEFGVASRYTDAHEMLEREKPDVLHAVMLPALRAEPMAIAAEHGVPLVILEKPIALWGEDWRKVKALGESSGTRFVVNTQLHFHARNLEMKADVADGKIGEVRHIDVSARSTPLDQGVHVLELAHSYNGYSPLKSVFGQIAGAQALESRQPSPDMAEASFLFGNNVHATFVCGSCAPRATDSDIIYMHKRIAVYGTRGFVHWTMAGWERSTPEGGYECGAHNYGTEDDLAQGRLTEACFACLDDERKPHPTRLERSLEEFNAILGLYASALTHAPVELPCDPADGLAASVKAALGA